MKLICFPNYSAGGLLCDLLNNTVSEIVGMTMVGNMPHNIFKSYDNGRVCRTFDESFWLAEIEGIRSGKGTARYKFQIFDQNLWFGTHCHPSCIPDYIFAQFDSVMAITTERRSSKFFRYLRTCHAFPTQNPKHLAINTQEAFESNIKCVNIEFEDIVNGKVVDDYKLNDTHFNNWKNANKFLYTEFDQNLVNIFNEVLGE